MSEIYNSDSIVQLEALDHIRQRPGMYIGDVANPTKLLIEVLDNAIDECQNGKADKIIVSIDTKSSEFVIADNGRGIPFDYKLNLYDDPPIKICNSIFTSGKFKKNDDDESAYGIAAGLNGVGLTVVNALSEYMNIEVFRKNKKASYKFKYKEEPIREPLCINDNKNFSTIITVKPHSDYFSSMTYDMKLIEERLLIAAVNFEKLKVLFKIDENVRTIAGNEDDLIEKHLGKNIKTWYSFLSKNKDKEKKSEMCYVKFGWDFDEKSTKMETFSTVNFVKVSDGSHITKFSNILKTIIKKYAKKQNREFEDNDCLNWLKVYINLKIVNTNFDSQTKERLGKGTDLSVMDNLEKLLDDYIKQNIDEFDELMERFEIYRKSIQNKKIINAGASGKKRGTCKFTKLRDCTMSGGELLIGEGDSAIGGLVQKRDPKLHAVLPLRGVVMNAASKSTDKLFENNEVKDIITAMGCGIIPHCDISKLRYNKIILSADADDAGAFITSLLITLFAKLTPDVIKNDKLFVCETPLYGYGYGSKFTPLWTPKDLQNARNAKKNIRRFKGLGEFEPSELYEFTLNPNTRKLIPVKWSDKSDKLFELMSSPEERRKLALGEWKLDS